MRTKQILRLAAGLYGRVEVASSSNLASLWAMQIHHLTPILNVTDVLASIAWFEKWGWRKCWAWYDAVMMMDGDPRFAQAQRTGEAGAPSFAAVGAGHCEIFLCRGGQGGKGMPATADYEATSKGMWLSIFVEGVDDIHAKCVSAGLTVLMAPTNEPWGMREFHLQHPDGHVLRVSQGVTG
ncbi:MAG: bleomycin resistance family protein [Phycisphaerales bacterium]